MVQSPRRRAPDAIVQSPAESTASGEAGEEYLSLSKQRMLMAMVDQCGSSSSEKDGSAEETSNRDGAMDEESESNSSMDMTESKRNLMHEILAEYGQEDEIDEDEIDEDEIDEDEIDEDEIDEDEIDEDEIDEDEIDEAYNDSEDSWNNIHAPHEAIDTDDNHSEPKEDEEVPLQGKAPNSAKQRNEDDGSYSELRYSNHSMSTYEDGPFASPTTTDSAPNPANLMAQMAQMAQMELVQTMIDVDSDGEGDLDGIDFLYSTETSPNITVRKVSSATTENVVDVWENSAPRSGHGGMELDIVARAPPKSINNESRDQGGKVPVRTISKKPKSSQVAKKRDKKTSSRTKRPKGEKPKKKSAKIQKRKDTKAIPRQEDGNGNGDGDASSVESPYQSMNFDEQDDASISSDDQPIQMIKPRGSAHKKKPASKQGENARSTTKDSARQKSNKLKREPESSTPRRTKATINAMIRAAAIGSDNESASMSSRDSQDQLLKPRQRRSSRTNAKETGAKQKKATNKRAWSMPIAPKHDPPEQLPIPFDDDDDRSRDSVDPEGIRRPPKDISALRLQSRDVDDLSRGSLDSTDRELPSMEWTGLDKGSLQKRSEFGRPETPPLLGGQRRDHKRNRRSRSVDRKSSDGDHSEESTKFAKSPPRGKQGIGRYIHWPNKKAKGLSRHPSTGSIDHQDEQYASSDGMNNSEIEKTPQRPKSRSFFPWPTLSRVPSTSTLDKMTPARIEEDQTAHVDKSVERYVHQSPIVVLRSSLPESYPSPAKKVDSVETKQLGSVAAPSPQPTKPKSNMWFQWANTPQSRQQSFESLGKRPSKNQKAPVPNSDLVRSNSQQNNGATVSRQSSKAQRDEIDFSTMTVSEQREAHMRQYRQNQERREAIKIQSATRGYMARKRHALPKHQRSTAKQQHIQNRSSMSPKSSPSQTSAVDLLLQGAISGSGAGKLDERKYSRQQEHFDEPTTVAQQRGGRGQAFRKDRERRESIKIQSALRGYMTRKKHRTPAKDSKLQRQITAQTGSNPQLSKRKRQAPKKQEITKSSKSTKKAGLLEKDEQKDGLAKVPSPSNQGKTIPSFKRLSSFDPSIHLQERLQRDEEDEKQTKTIAAIKEERHQMYLQDLRRRKATLIQAVMRGHMIRCRYPLASQKQRMLSQAVNEEESKLTAKAVASMVKRFLFGKTKTTKKSKPVPQVSARAMPTELLRSSLAQDDIFGDRTNTHDVDFFGFKCSKYKHRTGHYEFEKSPHIQVEVPGVTEDARHWTGRKLRRPSNEFDKTKYWKERKAREEYDKVSSSMAAKQNDNRSAALRDTERREAIKIQSAVRSFLSRKSHPLPKKKSKKKKLKKKKRSKRKGHPSKYFIPPSSQVDGTSTVPSNCKSVASSQMNQEGDQSEIPDPSQFRKVGTKESSQANKEVIRSGIPDPSKLRKVEMQKSSYGTTKPDFATKSLRTVQTKKNTDNNAVAATPIKLRLFSNDKSSGQLSFKEIQHIQLQAMVSVDLGPGYTMEEDNFLEVDFIEKEIIYEDDELIEEVVEENVPETKTPKQNVQSKRLVAPKNKTSMPPKAAEKVEPVALSDYKNEALTHAGSTYSTNVGDSWWFPSVGSEDTRAYRTDRYLFSNTSAQQRKQFPRPPAKQSTTTYWEAVRDRYLPEGGIATSSHTREHSLDDSVSLLPSLSILNGAGARSTQGITSRYLSAGDDGESWTPPRKDGAAHPRSDPDGSPEHDTSTEENAHPHSVPDGSPENDISTKDNEPSWVPRESKPKPRAQRVDFSGTVQQESFCWARHLPSPSKRQKSQAEMMVFGDLEAPPLSPPGRLTGTKRQVSRGSRDIGPTDVEQGESSKSELQLQQGVSRNVRRALILVAIVLLLLGGGAAAAYFFWEDAPWTTTRDPN